MSYADQSALSQDTDFQNRLIACLANESRGKVTDPVAQVIMSFPTQGGSWFMPFIASAPTFADKFANGGQSTITDGDLLSAVQAVWADVATVHDLGGTP